MTDMLRSARDEESRRREEVQIHQLQQQVDELRRVLRDSAARQQWLEELHKQNEGRLAQIQIAQDQYVQNITQAMQARQMEDARVKQQIAELISKVDEPMKPLRELRSQIAELADSRRVDREKTSTELRPIQEVQSQMRELVSQIGLIADAQRQLRDLVHELDTVNADTRKEIMRVSESQRMEEQRLRRQGVELQEIVESLRLQFGDVVARSNRIDDLRKHFLEHVEGLTASVSELQTEDQRVNTVLQRVEKQMMENHVGTEDRLETVRLQHESETNQLRTSIDGRMDRFYERFQTIEDRIRDLDQRLAELIPHFDTLRGQDFDLQELLDANEEIHLRHELANIENQIEEMRQRRAKREAALATKKGGGLIKSVRDARPPSRPNVNDGGES